MKHPYKVQGPCHHYNIQSHYINHCITTLRSVGYYILLPACKVWKGSCFDRQVMKLWCGWHPPDAGELVLLSQLCDKSLYLKIQRGYCYQIWTVKETLWYKSTEHFSIESSNVITFWSHDIDKSLYLHLQREPRGLRSPMQMLRSSSTCFKYFMIIKFSKFCKKDKCSCGNWPACRLLYLYMKQVRWLIS